MFSDRLNRYSIYESKRNLKFGFIISFATRSVMSFNIVSALRPFSNIYSFASKVSSHSHGLQPGVKAHWRIGEPFQRFFVRLGM